MCDTAWVRGLYADHGGPVTSRVRLPTVMRSWPSTDVPFAVGVALDTMKQLESQVLMRSYQGFMK